MLVGEERTYELIEKMFKTLRECFSSEYVNIGMDEAHMLGLGKYLDKNGYHGRFEILLKHLTRVCEIARKYGFKPTMWSDMFIRIANDDEYYPETVKPVPAEIQALVPNDVGLIYWDYYHTDYAHYDKMLSVHESYERPVWFAGGAWSWSGFAPRNAYTLATMQPAMQACRDHLTKNVLITMWGDDGKECSFFSLLPSLYAIRKYYEGVTDEKVIKTGFEELTGENYDKFFDLDLLNLIGEQIGEGGNLCKYALYSDPFNGFLDSAIPDGANAQYEEIARKLRKNSKSGKYAYIFDCIAKLCDVLSRKAELGVLTRKAYQEKDRDALKKLVLTYKVTECNLEIFYKAFKKAWFTDNKPCGFDVHDVRLGALKQRVKSCRERLEGYLSGEIENIPELEEELLNYCGEYEDAWKKTIMFNCWLRTVTANVL